MTKTIQLLGVSPWLRGLGNHQIGVNNDHHHFDGQQKFRHILFAAAKVLPRSDTKCCPATECSIFELFRFQVHAWRSLGGKESWAFAKDVGTTMEQPLDNPLKVVESQPLLLHILDGACKCLSQQHVFVVSPTCTANDVLQLPGSAKLPSADGRFNGTIDPG